MSIDETEERALSAAERILNITPPLRGGIVARETIMKAIRAYEASKASDSAATLKIYPIPPGHDEVSITYAETDRTEARPEQPVGKSITDHPQWPLVAKEKWEAEQILGKALGYPWYKDDKKNFPDATDADGVCTGEHTLVTIAMEAASRLKRESGCREIICTDGSKVLIDSEDYPVLSRHNWYINYSGKRPYAITKLKTDQTTIWRCIFMHHMILGTSGICDHIDGNPLNNQKSNLRKATRQSNEWNKGKNKTARGKPCTSQYKGVSWHGKKWKAMIKRDGVLYDLGHYDNEDDAARAYNAKAIELSGTFAWVNPINESKDQL